MPTYRKLLRASAISFTVAAVAIAFVLLLAFVMTDRTSVADDGAFNFGMQTIIYIAFPATAIGLILALVAGGYYSYGYLDNPATKKRVKKKVKAVKKAAEKRTRKKRVKSKSKIKKRTAEKS